ncbi:MAG: phosphonate metabolism protein, partial [Rubrimonas sp.]
MTELSGYARYAIYYAPEPGSALARAGAAWLGADPAGAPPPPIEPAGLPRPRAELVSRAARYGLHATLKAPFRLAPGVAA